MVAAWRNGGGGGGGDRSGIVWAHLACRHPSQPSMHFEIVDTRDINTIYHKLVERKHEII